MLNTIKKNVFVKLHFKRRTLNDLGLKIKKNLQNNKLRAKKLQKRNKI